MDVTVLVNSCDLYEDTWAPFFALFKKYWENCPYEIILNTETKEYKAEELNLKCFHSYENFSGICYGERMIEHLKRIETDFVLLLMDDFFIRSPVKEDKIKQCIQWMKSNPDIAVFSFAYVSDPLNIEDGCFEDFVLRPKYGEYKLNLQAALWRKTSLLQYTKKHENPWEFEIYGSQRTFWTNERFYVLRDGAEFILNYGKTKELDWGIVRGKWMIEDVKPLFDKNGIEIDYSLRGFLRKSNIEKVRKVEINSSVINEIKSLGFLRWLTITVWRVKKIFMKIMRFPVYNDYIEYLRKNGGD